MTRSIIQDTKIILGTTLSIQSNSTMEICNGIKWVNFITLILRTSTFNLKVILKHSKSTSNLTGGKKQSQRLNSSLERILRPSILKIWVLILKIYKRRCWLNCSNQISRSSNLKKESESLLNLKTFLNFTWTSMSLTLKTITERIWLHLELMSILMDLSLHTNTFMNSRIFLKWNSDMFSTSQNLTIK